ncbi:MAG: hypothetical protein CMG07_04415 [Candidatus Marinimicrobia bacterium]|nr:hypothetical protein [Candidatus Neomarinimicrobiota bacterium]
MNILGLINPSINFKNFHTNLRTDIFSGITVAVIALPLSLAFGEISNLGPIAGIIGAIIGGIIGGIFGGCSLSISGPTAPTSAQISTFMGLFLIGSTNEPDLVAIFSIIFFSGLIIILISFLKISSYIHYLPYPIIAGFMCGIGILVILSQINPFFGLEHSNSLIQFYKNINYDALLISIPCLIVLLFWKILQKKNEQFAHIPSPLIALVLGTSIAYLLDAKVLLIGDKMNHSDYNNFVLYLPDIYRLSEFLLPAFALSGLIIIDSLLTCVIADNISGKRHFSDKEAFGQGLANLFCGLLGGVSTATATMFTVSNIKLGSKTILSSIIYGLTLLFILLGLKSLVASVPIACIAAILIKVGFDILDYRIMPIIKNLSIFDFLIFILVIIITVFYNIMFAVLLGLICSLLIYFKQLLFIFKNNEIHKFFHLSENDNYNDRYNKSSLLNVPIGFIKSNGPLFFGSINSLIKIKDNHKLFKNIEILIIDISKVSMFDLSGVFGVEDFITNLKRLNKDVYIVNSTSSTNKYLKKINFARNIGKKNYYRNEDFIDDLIQNDFMLKLKK